MMNLSDLREIYGSVYLTETPDGLRIPWKPLSMGDFIDYEALLRNNPYTSSIIENEIFTKCVLDKSILKNIDLQKAGTINLIVTCIMQYSGPQEINEFNQTLDIYRAVAEQPMHHMITVICQAFPSYTPDDLYKLDYQTLMLRLAMAESKLMRIGALQEPIRLYSEAEEKKIQEKPKKKKIDIEKLQEAFYEQKKPSSKPAKIAEDELPDLASSSTDKEFIVPLDNMNVKFASGADMEDLPLIEHKMKQEGLDLYKDYIDQMKSGNKVKIKTYEERVQEAHKRSEQNAKKLRKK